MVSFVFQQWYHGSGLRSRWSLWSEVLLVIRAAEMSCIFGRRLGGPSCGFWSRLWWLSRWKEQSWFAVSRRRRRKWSYYFSLALDILVAIPRAAPGALTVSWLLDLFPVLSTGARATFGWGGCVGWGFCRGAALAGKRSASFRYTCVVRHSG